MNSPYNDIENPNYQDSALLYSDGSNWPSQAQRRRKWVTWERVLFLIGWVLAVVFFLVAVIRNYNSKPMEDENVARIDILQLNDVYELLPIAERGGISRLAAVREDIQNKNPSGADGFFTVLAGDFFSPSALGLAPVLDPKTGLMAPLHGKQMVDVFNHVPVDIAVFGNHEFDIPETDFRARCAESKFKYIATNLQAAPGSEPFPNTVEHMFLERSGIKFAVISASTDDNSPSYVRIAETQATIKEINKLLDKWTTNKVEWDILLAVTHWNLSQDQELAAKVPRIDLILGGHEHENWYLDRGTGMHPLIIAKADSNVKTVYQHTLRFNRKTGHAQNVGRSGTAYNAPGSLHIASDLIELGPGSREVPAMTAIVDKWLDIAYDAFRKSGIEPSKPMALLKEPINGLDNYTRRVQSPLCKIVLAGMTEALSNVDENPAKPLTIMNTGALRIDDMLHPGVVREYDALRVLPFGGLVSHVKLTGVLFLKMLKIGHENLGNGRYLNYPTDRLSYDANTKEWILDGERVTEDETYSVVLSHYMRVTSTEYFTPAEKEQIQVVSTATDNLQVALVRTFRKMFPIPPEQFAFIPQNDDRISPIPNLTYFE